MALAQYSGIAEGSQYWSCWQFPTIGCHMSILVLGSTQVPCFLTKGSIQVRSTNTYQYILKRRFSLSLITLIWLLHGRRLSKCRPRYFTVPLCGKVSPPIVAGQQSSFLKVKVTWLDLAALTLILHVLGHLSILLSST